MSEAYKNSRQNSNKRPQGVQSGETNVEQQLNPQGNLISNQRSQRTYLGQLEVQQNEGPGETGVYEDN